MYFDRFVSLPYSIRMLCGDGSTVRKSLTPRLINLIGYFLLFVMKDVAHVTIASDNTSYRGKHNNKWQICRGAYFII